MTWELKGLCGVRDSHSRKRDDEFAGFFLSTLELNSSQKQRMRRGLSSSLLPGSRVPKGEHFGGNQKHLQPFNISLGCSISLKSCAFRRNRKHQSALQPQLLILVFHPMPLFGDWLVQFSITGLVFLLLQEWSWQLNTCTYIMKSCLTRKG